VGKSSLRVFRQMWRNAFVIADGDGAAGGQVRPIRVATPGGSSYSGLMSPLRARVENGRIVLDEPTTLRDGTVIDLVADDEGDDLTNEERHALHEALSASWKSAEAGRLRPASAILDELRRRR
jgi:hypothetical protein